MITYWLNSLLSRTHNYLIVGQPNPVFESGHTGNSAECLFISFKVECITTPDFYRKGALPQQGYSSYASKNIGYIMAGSPFIRSSYALNYLFIRGRVYYYIGNIFPSTLIIHSRPLLPYYSNIPAHQWLDVSNPWDKKRIDDLIHPIAWGPLSIFQVEKKKAFELK